MADIQSSPHMSDAASVELSVTGMQNGVLQSSRSKWMSMGHKCWPLLAMMLGAIVFHFSSSGTQDLHNASSTSVKHIAGVPVYNFHLRLGIDDLAGRRLRGGSPLVSDWLLMFQGQPTDEEVHTVCTSLPGHAKCQFEGHPSQGGVPLVTLRATDSELESLLATRGHMLSSVEPDGEWTAIPEGPDLSMAVAGLPWGLDRIDDRSGLDNSYQSSPNGGKGVHVYVLDTGIRTTHDEFKAPNGTSRAVPTLEVLGNGVIECKNLDTSCAADKQGHGTHCAGTIGGANYGVAKGASLHAVKVLSDSGSGQWSWFIEALDWVATHGQRPAVVSASLGGGGRIVSVEVAVKAAVAAGVTVVVAAGNSNADACGYSPAHVPAAITVGATDKNDKRASFSSYGPCLDIFAPGVSILSAGKNSDKASATFSGTSMACPHVSGAAALLLEKDALLSPSEVAHKLRAGATAQAVQDAKPGSPNLLLYVGAKDNYTWTTTTSTTAPMAAASGFCGFEGAAQPYCGIWHQSAQDKLDWTRRSGSTPSSGTGPSGAHGGSYYIYTEVSSPVQPNDYAILEALTPTLKYGAFLSFFYHMKGAGNMGALKVKVRSTTTSATSELWSISGNQGDQWNEKMVSLDAFAGDSVVISLVGNKGASGDWKGDIAIDDVMLSTVPFTGTTTTVPFTSTATTTIASVLTSTMQPNVTTTSTFAATTAKPTTKPTTIITSTTSTSSTSTATSTSSETTTALTTTSTSTTTVTTTITTTTGNAKQAGIQSGDTVFLKSRSGNGNHIDVEASAVQARWESRGEWQSLVIEKKQGGSVHSGDTVYLRTHTGAHIDVTDEVVQARWNDLGQWQALVIEKRTGSGAILPDDEVCFKAHTGKHLHVEGGAVRAVWNDCGDWQAMLIQHEVAGALFSGSSVHLLAHTGSYVDVEGNAVRARWNDRGDWQKLSIENYGGRAIYSGDAVFLKAHTGLYVDVRNTSVHAEWNDRGEWQKFIIERRDGSGAVLPGDTIFLRAHTGMMIEVEGNVVQARWSDRGTWQSLVITASDAV